LPYLTNARDKQQPTKVVNASPGQLSNLSDGLAASADDGSNHFGLDEDPQREVDISLKLKRIFIINITFIYYKLPPNTIAGILPRRRYHKSTSPPGH
jgi:hypothetical protein